jgi:hypothetical protein
MADFATPIISNLSYDSSGRPLSTRPFIPAAVRTADLEVAALDTNDQARGVLLYFNVTVASGTGVTPNLIAYAPGQNPGGTPPQGKFIATAGAAITSAAVSSMLVYPSASVAGYTTNVNSILPPKWGVWMDHSDGASLTYEVFAFLLP